MGDPVRIVDLARDLVRLAGRDPDTLPMDIVGIRPGEKLHEELFYDAESVEPTAVPKVLKAVSGLPPASIRADARSLLAIATGAREDELRRSLLTYVGVSAERGTDAGEELDTLPGNGRSREMVAIKVEGGERTTVATSSV
jgi:FlaA1/EpsC-like NDP-sugar epimerase